MKPPVVLGPAVAMRSGANTISSGVPVVKLISFPASSAIESQSLEKTGNVARLAAEVFVGRERELAVLFAALEDAVAGHGRLVLLVGEPGIGKTRTANELAMATCRHKAQVFIGRCCESAGAPPFWPWVQIVRAYITNRGSETLRAELGTGAADIAQIIAEVRERLPDLPTPPLLEPQQARFRFFDSFTTFLKNAAKGQPLVLILDDLHWADTSSLLLLQFLVREFADAALLVVGTYRDVDFGSQHPLTHTLGELARTPGSQSLILPGLTEQEVARFITLTTGSPPTDTLATTVYQKTEGNPFFVTEVVQRLVSETSQSTLLSPSSLVGLPRRVREAICHRLQTLSAECHHLLTIAAVIGREFSLKLLAITANQASATTASTVLDVLDEAVATRLIAAVPNKLGHYVFSHALIRETLYEALSTAQRIRLHSQVGEALEEYHTADQELHVAELALHFFQAAPGNSEEKAIAYAQRAGERAMKLLAYEEAISHYERALQVMEQQKPNEERRCELLLGLGDALWRAGESLRAREAFVQAAQVAQGLGRAEVLARAALGLGNVRAETGLIDDVLVGLLDATLTMLSPEDSVLRTRVMARLAMALYYSPAAAERRNTLSVEALAMAQRTDERSTLAFALLARHFIRWGLGSVEERLTLATEAVRLAQEAGDLGLTLEGQAWRILALFEQGDIGTVDREIDNYTRWSAKFRLPRSQWYLTLVRSARAFLAGRFVEGEQLATEAASVPGEASDQANAVMTFGAQLFTVRREQGRLGELEPILTGFALQFALLPIWRCSVTAFHCEMGNLVVARREFDSLAAQNFAVLPYDGGRPASLALLSEACNMLGDVQRAELLYQFILPYAEQNIVVATSAICYGPATRYLGLLATTMARWDVAARHFSEACTMSEKMGARPWTAHIQYDHAQMLLVRNQVGDYEKAMPLLDQALMTAQELGMKDLEEKIKSAVASCQLSEKKQLETRDWRREAISFSSQAPRRKPLVSLFRRDGDYWSITYQGTTICLKDLRGLQYLAQLLRNPHKEFHALELVALETGTPAEVQVAQAVHYPSFADTTMSGLGDAGEMLDAKARAVYKHRLEELRAELEEAQVYNDLGRIGKAKQEMDFLTKELTKAFGLHGRYRKVAAHAERARVSVTRRITVARQKIATHHPALDRYLALTIKTGMFCSYIPHPDFPISWKC